MTQKLLDQLKADPSKIDALLPQIAKQGKSAVPELITAFKNDRRLATQAGSVLLAIDDDAMLDVYMKLIEERSLLRGVGFHGLTKFKTKKALELCISKLDKFGARKFAVKALGEFSFEQAILVLKKTFKTILTDPFVEKALAGKAISINDIDESDIELLPYILIALAKLGDIELVSYVEKLLKYDSDSDYSNALIIRKDAAAVLQYAVFPEFMDLIQTALNDEYFEVRMEAIDAAYYLGTKESVEMLMPLIDDKNEANRNNTIVRLQQLTGIELKYPDESSAYFSEQWSHERSKFKENISYRNGKPFDLSYLIDKLKTSNYKKYILQEIKVITGQDFGTYLHNSLIGEKQIKQIEQWWAKNQENYEVGKAYRYGRKQ